MVGDKYYRYQFDNFSTDLKLLEGEIVEDCPDGSFFFHEDTGWNQAPFGSDKQTIHVDSPTLYRWGWRSNLKEARDVYLATLQNSSLYCRQELHKFANNLKMLKQKISILEGIETE
jgi:hypothetical protein